MAKTSQEIEKEFIDDLQKTTGKDLTAWLASIKDSGIDKRNDLIAWLKTDQGFGHLNASMLAAIYLNGGKPVYGNPNALIDDQFKGKEALRPLYEDLKKAIAAVDANWQFVPTKLYTSIRNGKEFAAIIVKKEELKVAMDLGDEPLGEYFQQAKNLGPMPRISHVNAVKNANDINQDLLAWLQKADTRVNKK
ncbi:MAG: DUF5655 domain-containing protein [Saprospiraceae bacterium]|nr:DUF5655 domain-containing protein [Saprospiraceae bacterium]